MADRHRRSMLASSATLLTGSLVVPTSAVGTQDTNEDETADTSGGDIEVDVTVEETTHIDDFTTEFELCVRNYGDEAVSVPVSLEIGAITDEEGPLEIGPGESEDETLGFVHPRSLGAGEHEWTITAGGATETGTLVVEADDDYEERDEGFHLSLISPKSGRDEPIVHTLYDGQERSGGFLVLEIVSYHYEPVEREVVFEVGDETQRTRLEFEPRRHRQPYFAYKLEEGEYEWTASIGDDSVSGQIHIVPEEC
ncbi:hypothetical protein [Natrinema salaciae]|nr:hypothetical protein [Natrinema salaciae]